jgi:hypothetical protein
MKISTSTGKIGWTLKSVAGEGLLWRHLQRPSVTHRPIGSAAVTTFPATSGIQNHNFNAILVIDEYNFSREYFIFKLKCKVFGCKTVTTDKSQMMSNA